MIFFVSFLSLPQLHRTLPRNEQILSSVRCAGAQDETVAQHPPGQDSTGHRLQTGSKTLPKYVSPRLPRSTATYWVFFLFFCRWNAQKTGVLRRASGGATFGTGTVRRGLLPTPAQSGRDDMSVFELPRRQRHAEVSAVSRCRVHSSPAEVDQGQVRSHGEPSGGRAAQPRLP